MEAGVIISQLINVPVWEGTLLFLIPSAIITYKGLKAVGIVSKYMSILMVALILILTVASFMASSSDVSSLMNQNWKYAIPIFNIAAFSYIGQYLVTDLARGLTHDPKKLAPSLLIGQIIVAVLLIMIHMGTFIVAPANKIEQVATITWGKAIGQWAFFTANIFALMAMFTSFCPITQTLISNYCRLF